MVENGKGCKHDTNLPEIPPPPPKKKKKKKKEKKNPLLSINLLGLCIGVTADVKYNVD